MALYTVSFVGVSITAVQDLLQIKCPAGMVLRVKRLAFVCVQQTAPASSQLSLQARVLPATVSDGTGGGSVTPAIASGIGSTPAAGFTCLINNTAKATTSGTPQIIEESGMNILQGYDNGGLNIPIAPLQSLVFELLTAPLTSILFSGMASVEQIN